jgi:hemolysin activation/secretion protein
MVMFKARFKPMVADKPQAAESRDRQHSAGRMQQQQQQQRQQPQQQQQPQPRPRVPPIEEERGPQVPVKEPEPLHEPERAV